MPFGGGTNVVGALSMDNLSARPETRCTLDLRNYKKLLKIDDEHLTATFESGILGPVSSKRC